MQLSSADLEGISAVPCGKLNHMVQMLVNLFCMSTTENRIDYWLHPMCIIFTINNGGEMRDGGIIPSEVSRYEVRVRGGGITSPHAFGIHIQPIIFQIIVSVVKFSAKAISWADKSIHVYAITN